MPLVPRQVLEVVAGGELVDSMEEDEAAGNGAADDVDMDPEAAAGIKPGSQAGEDEEMPDEDEEPPPERKPLVLAHDEAVKDFKEEIAAVMKERADRFEEGFAAEQKIRLGEAGWKAR